MLKQNKNRWLLAAVVLLAVSGCSASKLEPPAYADSTASPKTPDLDRVKKQILTATNQFRKEEKRGELKENTSLAKAAQAFAEFMARTDKYSHEADGKDPGQRVADAGYQACIVAENIAFEYSSAGFTTEELAKGFIEGWKKSPPHRKNLLDADVDEIGVGVAHSSQSGKYYAVQNFGRPKSEAIVFKITNQADATIKYSLAGKDFSVKPRSIMTHEICRPSDLKVQLPGGQAEKVLRPTKGSHYLITKNDAGNYQIEKE
jgi:uncharacterized protein YkwD